MSISNGITDREYDKFIQSPTRDNKTSVEVFVGNKAPIPVEEAIRGASKIDFNEINSTGTETLTIINKTISAGLGVKIKTIDFSGENRAVYSFEVNGIIVGRKRTYLTWFDGKFEFKDMLLSEGDNIKVIVENKTNEPASFNASLMYNEYSL